MRYIIGFTAAATIVFFSLASFADDKPDESGCYSNDWLSHISLDIPGIYCSSPILGDPPEGFDVNTHPSPPHEDNPPPHECPYEGKHPQGD